ncbi:tripartite tricarboxylate transporter permease [Geodermatophilus sp. YIM 151500]|uniref:tripartite tricarboxylate transporter permease n=1 Tax=Geodermatophilus sp. YIM 151500 TaxID=2984531 RepID=UPI0021E4273A|nr:tripartite tricarboxylate transporter permease [Geodermatophilus sp. YIM 151500]MCV2489191.1 tripartite tricarboxylate transporter permease [Geodermatophilus sp. YIM 151500]
MSFVGGGQQRYTFGSTELINGIDVIPVAIGLFGVGHRRSGAAASGDPSAVRELIVVGLLPIQVASLPQTCLTCWIA